MTTGLLNTYKHYTHILSSTVGLELSESHRHLTAYPGIVLDQSDV